MNTNQQKTANQNQLKNTACGAELTQKQVVKNKMTEAMQKIDAYRDQRVSHLAITDKHLAEDFSSVVYFYSGHNGPVAIGFSGRSKKFSFHIRFKTAEIRAEYVTNWMQQQKERVERRKPEARALKVGDVLRSSWGYEQTNIDYYMVTKLIGKQSVEIVEIGREVLPTGDMTGACIPDKKNIIGKPMRKKADGNSVRITSFSTASKKEPRIVAGCEIFNADRFSSYH